MLPIIRILKSCNGKFNIACFCRYQAQDATANDSAVKVTHVSSDQQELYLDTAEEDEIEKKRNKNRLPEHVYSRFVKKECSQPVFKHDFMKKRLRVFYGRFGQGSMLNPGIMWPTKEELDSIIEYDQLAHPSIKQSLKEIAEEKMEKQKAREEDEQEVEINMAKHDQWLKDHYQRIAKKEADAEVARKKRQDLIDEISDFLGYEVNPSDPRFKEAVEQREIEKKKAHKLKKQQESYNRMLKKLTEIAQEEEKTKIQDNNHDDEDDIKK